MKKITLYRKCRRSKEENYEFLSFLKYENLGREDYEIYMKKYMLVNTGDLLLLNTFQNLMCNESISSESDEDIIRLAFKICKNEIEKNQDQSPSAATKNASIFSRIQDSCQNVISFS